MTEFARCPAFNIECQYVAEVDRLSAENERLRERLIGIRAEIDDMDNPFDSHSAPEKQYGFEVAVDQAVNIVTAALGETK